MHAPTFSMAEYSVYAIFDKVKNSAVETGRKLA